VLRLGFCHFFAPKKVTKKGSAVEKSNHFDCRYGGAKKLAATFVLACGPHDWLGSNSFLLNPPPRRQNGDFSKAFSPAENPAHRCCWRGR